MRAANLTIIITRLEAQVVDVDVLVEVFDAETLSHALAKGVFEIQKAAVASVLVIKVRAKYLSVHLQLAVFRQQVPIQSGDVRVTIVVLYCRC